MYNGAGVGLGDAMILSQGANGGWGGNGGCFMWVILLFALMGGGFGGWGNRGDVASTRDVYASNDFQSLRTAVNNLGSGLADLGYALNTGILNGFSNTQRDISNGTYVIDKAITDNRYVLGNAINETRFAGKDNACAVNRNIDQLRFDNTIGMNNIQAAIHAEGEETRKLIVANQMEQLKYALAEKDRNLQTAQFALSQQAQNATIINAVRPFPVPSFQVGNPYGNCSCNCGVTYGCQ